MEATAKRSTSRHPMFIKKRLEWQFDFNNSLNETPENATEFDNSTSMDDNHQNYINQSLLWRLKRFRKQKFKKKRLTEEFSKYSQNERLRDESARRENLFRQDENHASPLKPARLFTSSSDSISKSQNFNFSESEFAELQKTVEEEISKLVIEEKPRIEEDEEQKIEKDGHIAEENKNIEDLDKHKDGNKVDKDEPKVEEDKSTVEKIKSLLEKDKSTVEKDKSTVEKNEKKVERNEKKVERNELSEEENKPKKMELQMEAGNSNAEANTSLIGGLVFSEEQIAASKKSEDQLLCRIESDLASLLFGLRIDDSSYDYKRSYEHDKNKPEPQKPKPKKIKSPKPKQQKKKKKSHLEKRYRL